MAKCVVCGCTDERACMPVPCSWIAVDQGKGLGLCSSCDTSDNRLLFINSTNAIANERNQTTSTRTDK